MNGSVKKILNNGAFIAHLAPMLDGPDAAKLASAAQAYRDIVAGLGIRATAEASAVHFHGCDQAQLLVKWIAGGETPDADLMRKWTADIWSAINDLAFGRLP